VLLPSSLSLGSMFWFSVQVFMVSSLTYFFLIKRLRGRRRDKLPKLSETEKEALIANWKPDPLVPDELVPSDGIPLLLEQLEIEGKVEKFVILDGTRYFNMATMNFLGFVGDQRIEEAAKQTIFKYGVGSCGPRSFYGTVDVHIDFEKQIAKRNSSLTK